MSGRARGWTLPVAAICLAASLLAAQPVHAQELQLPVPSVTIYPNEAIGEDQLADRAFIASTVVRGSVLEDRSALVGKVARRTLLKGQPVPVGAIRDPYLVQQGKSTRVVFEAGGLTISGQATALGNGLAGDTVSLRNPDSGILIKGVVAADGSVRLGTP
jgi:flagellar basal body P-ring formation protein FlgA